MVLAVLIVLAILISVYFFVFRNYDYSNTSNSYSSEGDSCNLDSDCYCPPEADLGWCVGSGEDLFCKSGKCVKLMSQFICEVDSDCGYWSDGSEGSHCVSNEWFNQMDFGKGINLIGNFGTVVCVCKNYQCSEIKS